MTYTVLQGNNIDLLKSYPDNHFDSIVTDPPYGIDFLGKSWDANTGALETYQECLRVLKPGGHILAFSAARTYHHLAITLEQAGFEIRDQIMWIYSSGFPKSQDVGKQLDKKNGIKHKYTYLKNTDDTRNVKNSGTSSTPYCIKCDANMSYPPSQCKDRCDAKHPPIQNEWAGWGTALKPAHEPIALARKPSKLSIAKNCQTHGVGALNIDATRIQRGDETKFPSNVIGEISEPYQKYFYCPKVSRRERHIGFELPPPNFGNVQGAYDPETGERFAVGFNDRAEGKIKKKKYDPLAHIPTNPEGIWDVDGTGVQYNAQKNKQNGNNHPTVKPVALMKYLIKLVTPQGGHVLDPFCGSGSTGMAAVELGYDFTGCELDPAYVDIALKRIAAWNQPTETKLNEEWFDDK